MVFELQPENQRAERKRKHIFFITDDTKLNTSPKFLKEYFKEVNKENKKARIDYDTGFFKLLICLKKVLSNLGSGSK